jgi:hypothetical protein
VLNGYVTDTFHIAKHQLTTLIILTAQDNNGIYFRDRTTPNQNHPRARFASRRASHGVQLIEAAQARWRMVNAPHLVALVRAGARFEAGKLIERPNAHPVNTPTEAAA